MAVQHSTDTTGNLPGSGQTDSGTTNHPTAYSPAGQVFQDQLQTQQYRPLLAQAVIAPVAPPVTPGTPITPVPVFPGPRLFTQPGKSTPPDYGLTPYEPPPMPSLPVKPQPQPGAESQAGSQVRGQIQHTTPGNQINIPHWNNALAAISSTLQLKHLSPAEQLQINRQGDRNIRLQTQYALGLQSPFGGQPLALTGSLQELFGFLSVPKNANLLKGLHAHSDGLSVSGLQQRYTQAIDTKTAEQALNHTRALLKHLQMHAPSGQPSFAALYPGLSLSTVVDRSAALQNGFKVNQQSNARGAGLNDPYVFGFKHPVIFNNGKTHPIAVNLTGSLDALGPFIKAGGYGWLAANGLIPDQSSGLTTKGLVDKYEQAKAAFDPNQRAPQQTGGDAGRQLVQDIELKPPDDPESTVKTELPYGDEPQSMVSVKPSDTDDKKNNGVIGINPTQTVQTVTPSNSSDNKQPIKASDNAAMPENTQQPAEPSNTSAQPPQALFVNDAQLYAMRLYVYQHPEYQNIHSSEVTNTKRLAHFDYLSEKLINKTINNVREGQNSNGLHQELQQKRYDMQRSALPEDPGLEDFNPGKNWALEKSKNSIFYTYLTQSYKEAAEFDLIQLFLSDTDNLYTKTETFDNQGNVTGVQDVPGLPQGVTPKSYIVTWFTSSARAFINSPAVSHIAGTNIDGKKVKLTRSIFLKHPDTGMVAMWLHAELGNEASESDRLIAANEANKIYDHAMHKLPGDRSIIQNMANQYWLRMHSIKQRGGAAVAWQGMITGLRSKGFLVPKLADGVPALDLKAFTTTRKQFVENFESYFSAPIRYIDDSGGQVGGLITTPPQQPQGSSTPAKTIAEIQQEQALQQQQQQNLQNTYVDQATQPQQPQSAPPVVKQPSTDLFANDAQLDTMQQFADQNLQYQNIHTVRGTNTKRIDSFDAASEKIIANTVTDIRKGKQAATTYLDLQRTRYSMQVEHHPKDPDLRHFNPDHPDRNSFFRTKLADKYKASESDAINLFLTDTNNLYIASKIRLPGKNSYNITFSPAGKHSEKPEEYVNLWRTAGLKEFSQHPTLMHLATTKIAGKKIHLTQTSFKKTSGDRFISWQHTDYHIPENREHKKIAITAANTIHNQAMHKQAGDRSIIRDIADQYWLRMQSIELRGSAAVSWWGLVSALRSKGFIVPKLAADVASLDQKVFTTTREQFVNNFESYFSAPIRYIDNSGTQTEVDIEKFSQDITQINPYYPKPGADQTPDTAILSGDLKTMPYRNCLSCAEKTGVLIDYGRIRQARLSSDDTNDKQAVENQPGRRIIPIPLNNGALQKLGNALQKMPSKTWGFLRLEYQKGTHYFNIANLNGKVYLIDSQPGRMLAVDEQGLDLAQIVDITRDQIEIVHDEPGAHRITGAETLAKIADFVLLDWITGMGGIPLEDLPGILDPGTNPYKIYLEAIGKQFIKNIYYINGQPNRQLLKDFLQ